MIIKKSWICLSIQNKQFLKNLVNISRRPVKSVFKIIKTIIYYY